MVELFLRFRDAFEFQDLVVEDIAYKNVLFFVDDNVVKPASLLLDPAASSESVDCDADGV